MPTEHNDKIQVGKTAFYDQMQFRRRRYVFKILYCKDSTRCLKSFIAFACNWIAVRSTCFTKYESEKSSNKKPYFRSCSSCYGFLIFISCFHSFKKFQFCNSLEMLAALNFLKLSHAHLSTNELD